MKRKQRKLTLQKETISSQLASVAGGSFLECVTQITICTCGYSCGNTCLGTCEDCPSWGGTCDSCNYTCIPSCGWSCEIICHF